MIVPPLHNMDYGTSTVSALAPLASDALSAGSKWHSTWFLDSWREVALLLSNIFDAMSAGIVFIFSNTIMPALAKLPDSSGILAMTTINDIIVNPLFVTLFLTGPVLSAVTAVGIWTKKDEYSKPARYYALATTLIYLFGQVFITVTQNVPRNNALLNLDPSSTEASQYWRNVYLTEWVSWNTARGIFATVASVVGMLALRFMAKAKNETQVDSIYP